MKYLVNPLVGVNEILLGSDRGSVVKIIGAPESVEGRTEYYDEARFQITYTRKGYVEFIEIYADEPDLIEVEIFGVSAFQTNKEELRQIVETFGNCSISEDDEYPHVYLFESLSLSFWSDSDPNDFSEEEVEQYSDDFRASHFFKSVGIGTKGYYS